ncbi:MAG TPA: hypothetical protein VHL77_13130 [Ferruginibacter sp.]|jgi:hypothetical protein|nr:hypothetical protein [Ferruginibacter sp.]
MKKIKSLIFFACAISAVQFVHAQTVDEIINKNIQAMGGREKMLSLKTVLMTGSFLTPGSTPVNILVTKKHLVGSRIDIEINGTKNYQLITPTHGWIFTPVQGDKEPRPLIEDQYKFSQVQLDLQWPFLDYSSKGIKVELAGKDTVDGSLCNKLKVVCPNGNVTVYSIDTKSNLIVKANTKMFQFGALEDVITTYGDYRKNADGYWFAYTFTNPRGTTKYENILTNVAVADDLFKL